jgi:hypothetical protein
MSERCKARIASLALDGPIKMECNYPDGKCLRERIESGELVVKKDEVFEGDCTMSDQKEAKETKIRMLANSFRTGPCDFQADNDARELIEDAEIFGPKH